jgi:hypothetical protein
MEGDQQMNYTSTTSPTSSLVFNNANHEKLRITADGRIICGEGLSKEEATQEAAKLLIQAFEQEIKKMVDARVAAMKETSK